MRGCWILFVMGIFSFLSGIWGSTEDLSEAGKVVDDLIASHSVMMFAKSFCGYCKAARSLMDEAKIEYYALDIDRESNGSELQSVLKSVYGQRTVPAIFIHGKLIGGYTDLSGLSNDGRLKSLIAEGTQETRADL